MRVSFLRHIYLDFFIYSSKIYLKSGILVLNKFHGKIKLHREKTQKYSKGKRNKSHW